nr:MAG TPA: hypothetical protein [Caudoviricetes sp.]DAO80917.1 MAG TPA: hypothetical protein [Caudoviricetes sp.]DAP58757.1 MAG TPA: hypothetical protein [Caudoviricetes sp.]
MWPDRLSGNNREEFLDIFWLTDILVWYSNSPWITGGPTECRIVAIRPIVIGFTI